MTTVEVDSEQDLMIIKTSLKRVVREKGGELSEKKIYTIQNLINYIKYLDKQMKTADKRKDETKIWVDMADSETETMIKAVGSKR